MKFQLSRDETLSTGFVKAGVATTVTAANADEVAALVAVQKAIYLEDNNLALVANRVGANEVTILARTPTNGVSLSTGVVPVGLATGTVFARIRGGSGAVALTDDGGGRVSLSGRSLLTTATPVAQGTSFPITFTVGTVTRTLTLVPLNQGTGANPVPPSGIDYLIDDDGTLVLDDDVSPLTENY